MTPPQQEPVSLTEARKQCRIPASQTSEDVLLDGLIKAARERAESITGRQLLEATWKAMLDDGPCEDVISIPKPPLISILSVQYLDQAGAVQTWGSSNYQTDIPVGPMAGRGRIAPTPAATWPITGSGYLNSFIVNFKAGYGTDPTSVPQPIKQAMLMMIGAWFSPGRADMAPAGEALVSVPLGALALLTPYKAVC